jgi:hypothetical protein
MRELTHEEAFDWIEKYEAQVWYNKHNRKWTCQVIPEPGTVIQPSAYGLWVAVQLASEKLEEWQTLSKTSSSMQKDVKPQNSTIYGQHLQH